MSTRVETHKLNMVCGNTYIFKEGYEYKSKLVSIDDGIMTFANGHTFRENTDTVFYEYRAVVVEEYVNRYNSAKNSKECQIRTVTQEFIDAVSAIIENQDALHHFMHLKNLHQKNVENFMIYYTF